MDSRPTRAVVIYLGESRRLAGSDSAFLDAYFYRAVRDSAFRRLFSRQIRVKEGADTFWLATQDSLLPDLAAEVPPGGSVTLFVRWQGARQDGPVTSWLFTVNEFAAAKSEASWERVLAAC